ncbi:hypothetical protein WN943_019533 [Citrus x changshan-huyou]
MALVMNDGFELPWEVKSYQSEAESLLKEYILADPFVPYTSIVGSIFACTMVYDLAQLISVRFTLNLIPVSPTYSGSSGVTVAFARLLFPSEARVATDRADADATNFYTGLSASKSKGSSGNLKEVDLNETPSMQAKRLQLRLHALLKTVETGRRYFPRCSEMKKGTPEEQRLKRARFMELKEGVNKAFYKDMAEKIWLRFVVILVVVIFSEGRSKV